MSKASLSQEQLAFVSKVAAEAGAKAALETLEKERQRESREMSDRRLRNTKLLLRNYRILKEHAAHAVYEAETAVEDPMQIMEELMMPGKAPKNFVESIKRSASRTTTMVRHIDTMLHLHHVYCHQYGTEEDLRRWRVIDGLYISDDMLTVAELAEREGVVERTIYKDIDIACERISALMFGIDGIKKR